MSRVAEQYLPICLWRLCLIREVSLGPAVESAPPPALCSRHRLANVIEKKLSWLFLLYALPFAVVLSIITPPFQVPDELAHLQRADEIGHGEIISERYGGTIDGGWIEMGSLYQNMWFHQELKETVAHATQAGGIRWIGPKNKINFQNTAQYGPFFYLPQVIGLLLGRAAGISLAKTLVLARVLNGLAACGVGFLALSICRRGRALTFTTLLLPMTLSEFASASQDALLISLSILAVAMASRVLTERRLASTGEFAVFASIVVMMTMARPPLFALASLTPAFLGLRDPGWRSKRLIAAIAIAIVICWMRILSGLTPPMPADESVSGQFQRLLADPLLLPAVMLTTFAKNGVWLLKTVVGYLGWTDALMPGWYYLAAAGTFVMALIAPGNRGRSFWPGSLGLLTIAALVTASSLALYLTWTALGAPTINGLQGRYILPVLPLLAWAIPEYGPNLDRMLAPAWYPVLLFPLITVAVTPVVVMERYYGSWTIMAESVKALLLQ